MSGRIRSIKPELLDDAVTAGLSHVAFRLFVAAIVLADDYGNLRFEPGWLRGQVFWARDVPVAEIAAAEAELAPLVLTYEVNGQRYGSIRNWSKHQKVSHPGKPRVPGPPEPPPRSSGESPETLVPDLRSPISDPDLRSRPPTPEGPPARGVGRASDRFEVGTAAAETGVAVFQDAVAEATGKPFALNRAPFHRRDLCDLLNRHGPTGPKPEAIAWVRGVVAAWVVAIDPKYAGGWTPSKLLDWLNEGCPDKRTGKSAAEITKQPFDPEAPWMKLA